MAARPSRKAPAQAELSPEKLPARDIRADQDPDPPFLAALESLGVPELNQVLKRAQALKDGKLDSAKQDFMARMKAEGEQLGLDLGSLFSPAVLPLKRGRRAGTGTGSRGTVAPKYRNSAGDEWTGRGRMPKWLTAAEAEGKSRDEFLIEKPSALGDE